MLPRFLEKFWRTYCRFWGLIGNRPHLRLAEARSVSVCTLRPGSIGTDAGCSATLPERAQGEGARRGSTPGEGLVEGDGLVAFRRSLARHTLASHGRSQRRPPSRGSRALGSSRLRRDVAEGRLAAIRGDCRSPRRICGRRRQRGTRPGTARRGLRFRLGRWRALLRHHLLHGRGTEVLPALPGRACRPSAGDRSRRARPLPGGRTSARFPSPTWLAFHCCHPASSPATTAGCRGRG